MKKWTVILLCLAMALTFAGCDKEPANPDNDNNQNVTDNNSGDKDKNDDTNKANGGTISTDENDQTKVVDAFLRGAQEFDFDQMNVCFATMHQQTLEDFIEEQHYTKDFMKSHASKITYEITDSKVGSDNDATVTVVCKYVDAADMYKTAVDRSFEELKNGSGDLSDSDTTVQKVYQEEIANYKEAMTERTLTVDLIQEDGKWVIKELTDDLTDVVSCNFMTSMN